MTLSIFGDTGACTLPDRDALAALAREHRPRPEQTARIVIPAPAPVMAAPRWYRGVRRLDRSRAALLAARGGIGGSL